MRIVEAGHVYHLDCLDGKRPQELYFVRRIGDKFPFNFGGPMPGTNCQEVLRALIDRTRYMGNQEPCAETEAIIGCLESALLLFELRAARKHGRTLGLRSVQDVMIGPTCPVCGHVGCSGHEEAKEKEHADQPSRVARYDQLWPARAA